MYCPQKIPTIRYLESHPHYSADYQLINNEAISASHKAMHMIMVSELSRFIKIYSIIKCNVFLTFIMLLIHSVQGNACVVQSVRAENLSNLS